ncbi:hypothetical protein EI555_003525, partial [Monodon monoceros]
WRDAGVCRFLEPVGPVKVTSPDEDAETGAPGSQPYVTAALRFAENITLRTLLPVIRRQPLRCSWTLASVAPKAEQALPQDCMSRGRQTRPFGGTLFSLYHPEEAWDDKALGAPEPCTRMVLVRSENGQLLMIPQQALAQMQAQAHAQAQPQTAMAPRPATPTSAPPVQISTVQAPGTPIIARQVTPTTIIKQVSQAQTTVQPSTALQRSPGVQPQLVLGGAAQTPSLGTATAVQTGTPQRTVPGATTTSTAATETMENVKKCKNFLSTLIKLASSGKQSTETAANVKELVQNLLDGKIEAEDFTSRLYRELNSSPQPYLVPFLKRSLPALRQLTPDSAAFIQQSQQQPPPASQATTALTAVVLSGSVQRTAGKTAAAVTSALQPPVISLAQPTPVIQPPPKPGALIRPPQVTLTQTPMVALRQPHNRIVLTTPQQIQLNQLQPVPVVKPAVLPGTKALSAVSAQAAAAQKNKLKEPGGGSFRDDDDINDVASMAGVNLSEESARILATNSELVGTLTRSCKDETFLLPAPLQRRILEIGKKHGITELHPDVVSYVSHATQQRLQNLVEKISETAQQKNFSYKDDDRYEQASDVRAQLKFFEQLDQIEKQRKDEQEREILMRAAKAKDPEQLRLKQKAKEMQQQELAQMRQRDANLTALAAIGPRKKRKVDSPAPGSGVEAMDDVVTVEPSAQPADHRQPAQPRSLDLAALGRPSGSRQLTACLRLGLLPFCFVGPGDAAPS